MKKKKEDNRRCETVEEFLARGGAIQKVKAGDNNTVNTISAVAKTVSDLKTLPEAELLYGVSKVKTVDLSKVKRELLPDPMKEIYDRIITDMNQKTIKEHDDD